MLRKIFHSIVIAAVIIHIAICSEFFGGTELWSYLTYLCEFFFIIVCCQYVRSVAILNRLERLSIFYFVFVFFLTIVYGNASKNLVPLIGRTIEIATLLMIVKMHKDDLTFFIVTGTVVFSVCLYFNYYLLLLNPTGISKGDGEVYYLLGTNYNQIGPKVLFAFLFSVLLSNKYKVALINTIAIAIIGVASLLIVQSMTSTVSFIMLLCFYLIPLNIRIKKLTLNVLLAAIVLFQIFIVFLGNAINITGADSFLTLIGKDTTFTGRTELWAYSAGYFWNSPIWGHGYIIAADYFKSGFFHTIQNSHNYIYNILHKGGIILLFIIFQMVRIAYRKIKKKISERCAYTILMGGITFMTMSIFEVYDPINTYLLLIFMYYYNDITGDRYELSKKLIK